MLQLFNDNGLVVFGYSAHKSHVSQPLDVPVYSSIKHFLTREVSQLERIVKCADAFHTADVITAALSLSFTCWNIQSEFLTTGLWDSAVNSPNEKALEKLPFYDDNGRNLPTLQDVKFSFNGRQRALLSNADIDKTGTVGASTAAGAPLKSTVVLKFLERRNQKKLAEALQ